MPQYALSTAVQLRSGPAAHAPKGGRVDEMAGWFEEQLQPGDTVQALDWTGGTLHAMLLTEAKPATRFIQDFHFYHHISTPLIQRYRDSFINELRDAPPRFMVAVYTRKPWVSGIDTTRAFPDLRQLLDEQYALAHEGDGYYIFERTDEQ